MKASTHADRRTATFAGVIPILATPFLDGEGLELESWRRLLEFMVTLDIDGVTILGVLGESARLSDVERATLIQSAAAVAVPTAPKIRQVRAGFTERPISILSGLGARYAPFDLEAGSNGFNTGFAFPEVLQALVIAARQEDWPSVRRIYSRFAPLIVFEQQPGVAIRKELLRRRGLLTSARVRHPGQAISPAHAAQLDGLLARTFRDVDIRQSLPIDQWLSEAPERELRS